MTIRLIQILCIALTTAILFAINYATDAVGRLLGGDFNAGFLVGACFVIGLYGIICWIDPSSRPRGSAGKQQSPNDRVH